MADPLLVTKVSPQLLQHFPVPRMNILRQLSVENQDGRLPTLVSGSEGHGNTISILMRSKEAGHPVARVIMETGNCLWQVILEIFATKRNRITNQTEGTNGSCN